MIWEDKLKLPRMAKIVLAWLSCWTLFAVCAWLSISFAIVFGEARFNALVQSWGIALSQTFVVEEPCIIWIYLAIPLILDRLTSNDFTAELVNECLSSGIGSAIGKCFSLCKDLSA